MRAHGGQAASQIADLVAPLLDEKGLGGYFRWIIGGDTLPQQKPDPAALRHVLQRSGYQLCNGRETDTLGSLPLPAAHYHLGPLQLRDALLTLTGPARTLHVDHSTRSVCFSQPHTTPVEAAPATAESVPLQSATGEPQP